MRFFSFVVVLYCFALSRAFVFPATIRPPGCRCSTLQHMRSFGFGKNGKGEEAPNSIRSNVTLPNGMMLEFELCNAIASISSEAWNACLPTEEVGLGSAFLDHSWLRCLEESKCASPQTGWVPQHVSIKMDGEAKGFIPLYIKGHSSKSDDTGTPEVLCSSVPFPSQRCTRFALLSVGEFIFDSSWAEAAYQNKIDYYPKLLVAVPFTPATGARLLWHGSIYANYSNAEIQQLRCAAAMFLRQVAAANQISSVHINFLTDEEATDLAGPLLGGKQNKQKGVQKRVGSLLERFSLKDDYIRRSSIQYHWTNRNAKNNGKPYRSFDEYLSFFKSKRRINIRRERRKVADKGIRIDTVRGRDILEYPGLMKRMFEIYQSTIQKMYWGRQYLSLDFFEKLAESDFVDNLCFVCARYNSTDEKLRAEDVFAGTFNVVKDKVFYGRYWGCLGDEVKNLHFETCYWTAIEYCIENGLQRMEPGAGGGDYKWARGFDAALIHSVHYIESPGLRRAISQFVEYETENNLEVAKYLQSRRPTALSDRTM